MQLISNPFAEIFEKLDQLQTRVMESGKVIPPEIIDRKELCRRLGITEPTAIIYGKKKRIPEIRIGSCIRYNWISVVKALESSKK